MMQAYDYLLVETKDIVNYFKHELTSKEQKKLLEDDIDSFVDKLSSRLVNEDAITGNGSGSYTCNILEAEKNLTGNWELLRFATEELDPDFNMVKEGPEACDVMIRIYLLPEAIKAAHQQLVGK